MMHNFLSNNRDELINRCRTKVGERRGRSATERQLREGIPLFLDQLIRTLQIEQTSTPMDSRRISGPAGGGTALSEVSVSAAQHGKDLLELGLTVDQVVHDYGDLCQSITDLAVERDAPFQIDEFRTLNRCLDNAISDAVTEFGYQRDTIKADDNAVESNKRMGFFAHELRNQLGTASMAFAALKAGNLSVNGATGSILGRCLQGLDKLIASSIEDVRTLGQNSIILDSFSLSEFIAEIYAATSLSKGANGCSFNAPQVDPDLAINGTRDLLMAAVANLLQNAFKFTQPHTEVFLTAYAAGDRIIIDVKDHCGGLGIGVAESMFLPFSQSGENRTGIGLGLTIAKQSVNANGGTLTVEDLPSVGCIFKISLPRHAMPT
ncbi:HAMP domain-containing histidine kinase [Massilia sp. P8910]|uniref:sensor histidine kinase n=1 Tax=Massilia antarctica TaxID=2765360 RepID=UPI001E5E9CD3|nr:MULTISPECIES: HAMP domain-containing sensor histidine kinase [Massilia]MCE3602633.1 HAMP domain-containing histidine kinase [Massilia antarctica]MCY0916236.1 HAMP domain-containing sensor histidine kinase [Massilia sp. H27-R4]